MNAIRMARRSGGQGELSARDGVDRLYTLPACSKFFAQAIAAEAYLSRYQRRSTTTQPAVYWAIHNKGLKAGKLPGQLLLFLQVCLAGDHDPLRLRGTRTVH